MSSTLWVEHCCALPHLMRKFCLCKTREGGGVHRMLPSSCNTRFLKRISRSVRLLPTNRDTWIYNVAQRSEGAKCTSGEQRWHQRHTTASHQGGGLHRGDQMRTPGIEPGSQACEACMIPLHYVRCCSLIFQWGYFEMPYSKRGRPPILHGPNSWMPTLISSPAARAQ